ncbi:MAG TPA: c-type cytochrome [Steroidobacteraceae bacterium]|nr:c-type cytochrome [Steroidobacteraceae bacterium]
MFRRGRNFLLAMALLASALSACTGAHGRGGSHGDRQNFALIQRGRYLVTLADCTACHSDPTRSDSPFGGGHSVPTPFGAMVAPNITPDPQTGIGKWTVQQFDDAVRRGRGPDGKRLYPAMPFPYFARMSAADVRAIWAYLNTVKPVHHAVVADRLPFPFSIRVSMIFWDWLYFRPGEWHHSPDRSAAWNRGSYIVEGPGHCGACHTPKTFLGGDERSRALQGYALEGWFAPDLTDDSAHGLARWTESDIVAYLKTGHNRFDAASGPMAEEVKDASSGMSSQDLAAIATYLKDQRSSSGRLTALPSDNPVMVAGAAIYRDTCSGCHKIDGSGVPYLIPDLAGSAAVASRQSTTVLEVILHGAASVATREEPTGPQMPSYAWQLDDAQVAAVATYVRNSWGHAAGLVSPSAARAARESGPGADAQAR